MARAYQLGTGSSLLEWAIFAGYRQIPARALPHSPISPCLLGDLYDRPEMSRLPYHSTLHANVWAGVSFAALSAALRRAEPTIGFANVSNGTRAQCAVRRL